MSDTPRVLVLPEQLPNRGIGYSNCHRRRLEAAGRFPKRIMLSPRKHAYDEAELMAWVRERIAARDRKPQPEIPDAPAA